MIPGIRLSLGVPDHLLGIHRFAVDNGRDLPVRAAGVKADAAAVPMPADPPGAAAGRGKIRLGHGLQHKGALKHRLHKVRIEGAYPRGGVDARQFLRQFIAAADADAPAAHAPQQQLDGALQKPQISGAVRVVPQPGLEYRRLSVLPLHGDADGAMCLRQIGRPPRGKGDEAAVQRGPGFHMEGNAQMLHVHRSPPAAPSHAARSQISVTSG